MSVHRLVLCDADDLEVAALRKAAIDAGFEVVATADNAVELVQLAQIHQPDAALVRNEVPGVSGVEVTDDLVRMERRVEVVLVTSDPSLEPHGLAAGAFAVIPRGDVDALERALGALREWPSGGERRSGHDRRSGMDRRQQQEWSKVFAERRGDEDRRTTLRRKSDRARSQQPPPAKVIDIRDWSTAERSAH